MGWHVAEGCYGSHAGLEILNKSPTKHPHNITPPPLYFMVGTTHAHTIRSPSRRLTQQWEQIKKSQI